MVSLPTFFPGGVVAFSGRDMVSAAIVAGTWGIPLVDPSHVAIVGWLPTQCRPVLWESTMLCDQPCLLLGKRVNGVQVHEIGPRIEQYAGRVYYLPLAKPLSAEEAGLLTVFLHAHLGYTYDIIEAIRARQAGFGWLEKRFGEESLSSIFCSELVAAGLRAVDRFSTANASTWDPVSLCRALVNTGVCPQKVRIK